MQYLGARRLLAPVSSRTLLQAYNVQQFDAETLGLKYSEGDRRRLLDAGAPAGSRGLLQAYSVQQFDAETIGMKYSEGNRRRLLSPATSRFLLQAYNVQQFDAETIGLKYSEGDRRRLLGTDAPAASTYRTVTLGVTLAPSLSPLRCHLWPCIEDHWKIWYCKEPDLGYRGISPWPSCGKVEGIGAK